MVYSKPQRSVLYSLLIYSIFFFFENRGVYAQSEYANDKSVAEMEGEIENLIKENDFANAAKASLDLGLLYYNDANYSSAEKILKKGISYSQKAGDQDQFMTINYNLGILYTRINQYNEALDYFRASLKLAESMKHEKVIIDNNLNIGSIYLKTKKYNRAVKFTEDALKVSLDIFHEEKELECYELFVKIFKKSGDSSNLIEYKKRYDRLRRELDDNKKISDQLLSLEEKIENIEEENDEVYSELKEKSEFLKRAEDSIVHLEKVNEEKQMELNLNQMTIQAQEASIRSAKILRNSILIGIVLLIIIAVVLWKSYKSKKADSEKINKQNQDIKSSITYAQRIQEAMLSREKEHAELFEDSFIYFKPRDIVSGDFYWCEELNNDTPYNDIAITAVDCTGHGVPGAFMSMIGLNALDGIIADGFQKSNEILNQLHKEIYRSLKQDKTGNNDGMDIALCVYKPNENSMEFSGAKNPVIYFQDNEVFQIKGDRHPIGGFQSGPDRDYKSHTIKIDKTTYVYLFSDGYKDQFGGTDNTKFMAKKFRELLHEIHLLPMVKQKEILEDTLTKWRGEYPQTDDVLVLGFKLNPR